MKKILESIKDYFEINNIEGLKKIKKIFENSNLEIFNKIEMNSQKIGAGDIFLGINSGNNYAKEALEKGAFLVFLDRKQPFEDERLIYVENTVKFMQDLANIYRKKTKLKIIGITGSNGKTTTKDILYSILSVKYDVEKTKGNYNNHIGLPFTILITKEETEYLILEMGMSDLGEIDFLCQVSEPDYGIITNIGLSHMEILKNQENVFKAKTEMLKYIDSKKVYVNGDDKFLSQVKGNKIGFLQDGKNEIRKISNFIQKENGISFDFENEEYCVGLQGEYNGNNSALTIALAKDIGMTREEIQKGLYKIELTPMRFQKIIWNEYEVINDAYNASPLSMKVGLETFATLYKEREKIAIIGDMLELGDKEIFYHKEAIELAINLKFKNIFLYGERMEKAFEILEKNETNNNSVIVYFSSKEELKNRLLNIEKKDSVIYIKGSRGMKLEEILK